jgi:histidyl-tRNA synthetase
LKFQSLRGFRDYLPPDAATRADLFATLRRVARISGFEEIETPSLESLELIKVKSGEGIVEETFAFTDKGGREVTLVPENTPSLARIFAERAKITPLPTKWFALAKLWRYEEPQAGRLREFSQVSLDIYGVPGVEADVEILVTTKAMLDALGLKDRYVFRVSDRRIAEGLAGVVKAPDPAAFLRALDRSRKLSREDFDAELEKVGLTKEARELLSDLMAKMSGEMSKVSGSLDAIASLEGFGKTGMDGVENLRKLFSMGEAAGLSDVMLLDVAVVRGLAYYTSTVFEAFDRKEAKRSLFGGGRYDRLIELFGGGSIPACGVAMGDQVLELLVRESNLWPEGARGLDVYVASASEDLRVSALKWVNQLRVVGLSADRDLMGRNLTGQMKEAARRKAVTILLLAPKENSRGEVVLRNMQTGQQTVLPAEQAEAELLRVVSRASEVPPAVVAPPSSGAPPPA